MQFLTLPSTLPIGSQRGGSRETLLPILASTAGRVKSHPLLQQRFSSDFRGSLGAPCAQQSALWDARGGEKTLPRPVLSCRMFLTAHALHHTHLAPRVGVCAAQLAKQVTVVEATAESRGSYGAFPLKLSGFDGLQRSILNKNKCLQ